MYSNPERLWAASLHRSAAAPSPHTACCTVDVLILHCLAVALLSHVPQTLVNSIPKDKLAWLSSCSIMPTSFCRRCAFSSSVSDLQSGAIEAAMARPTEPAHDSCALPTAFTALPGMHSRCNISHPPWQHNQQVQLAAWGSPWQPGPPVLVDAVLEVHGSQPARAVVRILAANDLLQASSSNAAVELACALESPPALNRPQPPSRPDPACRPHPVRP